jgi:hypothetical protein
MAHCSPMTEPADIHRSAELGFPPLLVLAGIHVHCFVLTPVQFAVRLVIASNIDALDTEPPVHRLLPDRGPQRMTQPLDVPRVAHVQI